MPRQGGHHGLDYSFGLGYSFMTSNEANDDGAPGATIAIGKRLNSNFYIGGEVSGYVPSLITNREFGNDSQWFIPIMVDCRAYIPNNSKLTPFSELKAGFIFNTEYDNGGQSNHVGFGLMQGLSIELNNQLDLDISGGYAHRFHVGGEDIVSRGFVVMTVGIRFHK